MRKLVLIFIHLMFFFVAYGQENVQPAVIEFEKTKHDFGTVNEGGPITYEFKFTNKGKVPLTISNVKASCGCTTPGWTKEAVLPGQTGFVSAQYNTANRPGPFTKTLTVMANTEPAMMILTITGNVTPRVKTPEELYPKKVGNLRLFSDYVYLGKITTKEPMTKEVAVYNDGAEPIQFSVAGLPAHVEVSFEPQVLNAKEKGIIRLKYDALKKNDLGPVEDDVTITTNEVNENKKVLHIVADISEYYAPLSPEEAANAPKLSITSSKVDVGPVKVNTSKTVEVEISNSGKQDLILKKVRSAAAHISVETNKTTIKPGQTAKLKVTYKAEGAPRGDSQFIWIYSNDPMSPTQNILINSAVEQ